MAFLQITALFALPVFFLLAGMIPLQARFLVLAGVAATAIAVIVKERWTFHQLGLRLDNLRSGLVPYLVFTLIGTGIIILVARLLRLPQIPAWWTLPHFQFWFLPISILQEFLFRGFLIPKLRIVFRSPTAVVLVNAALFAFMHSIFPQPLLLLPFAFITGIAFAWMYLRFPNLILISIVHAILNVVGVSRCFFSFTPPCA